MLEMPSISNDPGTTDTQNLNSLFKKIIQSTLNYEGILQTQLLLGVYEAHELRNCSLKGELLRALNQGINFIMLLLEISSLTGLFPLTRQNF